MYRYDVYLGHRPGSESAREQKKSLADGYPFHASALRDTNSVLGCDSGSSHIDPNMLRAPRSGSFLIGNPTKLATGDALVTFYTNHMLTQK
jgi:cytosine/adenosine deaminase-related metal-dependent hydrolase